ncbi:MAG: hypothetical protein IT162_18605 [Bryobacterales bacterium]|nr:hypothetical protein [Bryobacterales bacterium]
MPPVKSLTSLLAILLLAVPPPGSAAQAPAETGSEQTPRPALTLVVLAGEGAANNLGQIANRLPSVRVEDEKQNPLNGATVVFSLPADGASGEFRDGSRTLIVTTNAQGVAEATGLRANLTAGRVVIHANASYRGLRATTNITQFNVAVPGVRAASRTGKKPLWLALAGGAAAAGLAVGLGARGGSGSATPAGPPPVSISLGSGQVGPPR